MRGISAIAVSSVRVAIAWFSVMTASVALAGEFDVAKLGRPTKVLLYDGGQIVMERAIAKDSDESKAVLAWLEAHKDGWRRAGFHTYAPHCLVYGDNFKIDFSDTFCVLNYRQKNDGPMDRVILKIRKGDSIPDVFKRAK